MSRRRKVLVGLLAALLALIAGCAIGLLVLVPGEGPAVLAALPIDADVIAYAEDIDALWGTLESSEAFRDFRRGPSWRALLDAGLGEALDELEKSGLEPSRSTASHLVGREAGAALWIEDSGGPRLRVASWLAAFRIDTYVRLADLAAGRVFMRSAITRKEHEGATVAELRQGTGAVHWTLLGDLLLVADGRAVLLRAVEGTRTRGDDTSFAGVFRSGLEAKSGSPRAGLRLGRPEGIVAALLGKTLPGGKGLFGGGPRTRTSRAMKALSALGLPAPLDRITIAMRLDGSRVLEDSFLAGPAPVPAIGGAVKDIAPPPGTFFWWRFRPGREPASEYAWGIFVKMVPPQDRGRRVSASGIDIFRRVVVPRVGSEVAIALAMQDVRAEGGGFPAQYSFVGVKNAALIHAGFEQLMRSRSLGVYSESERLPVSYPYVVRRPAGTVSPVYEMAIRNTRRFEGFRPSVAVRANDIVYCSSLEKLRELLEAPRAFRPSGSAGTIFPDLALDGWMSTAEVQREAFRIEWRAPGDFRQLRNAYDYVTELRRYRGPARMLLADETDYERVWRIAEDVLRRVRRHSRVGLEDPGGMRMRAVWDFADGE